jgi:hypothetical protein
MKVIKSYEAYNERRYGARWVALVNPQTAKIDFSQRVGAYSGGKGGAGDLYVYNPQEGRVYAYGQKDYRGNQTEVKYCVFENGVFRLFERENLIKELLAMQPEV